MSEHRSDERSREEQGSTVSEQPPDNPVSGAGLIRLGSVVGVPVFVTPSWLLIAAFVTFSYADFLRNWIPGTSRTAGYGLALLYAVALAVSVLAHELGHTLVSRRLGLPVRRIVVFLLGGVSEIEGEPARPRDEFAIAAAGPTMSFVLAGACWAAAQLGAAHSAVQVMFLLLAWSNLIVAVFNVLPGLPLDGGRLVQAVVWKFSRSRLTGIRIGSWLGRGLAVLLVLGVLFGNVRNSRSGTLDLAGLGATAMGFAIAAFLWLGASQTLRVSELGARAAALQLGHLVRPAVYLPPQTPVSEAVRMVGEARAAGIVVIDAGGRSRAIVRESAIAALQHHRRPWATIGELSRVLEPGLILTDTTAGQQLLDAVRAHPASEYLVVGSDGVSRGVLAAVDLARALGTPQVSAAQ